MKSFASFLSSTRSLPFNNVVMGNEACDLDSAVCAIVLSFLLSSRTGQLHAPLLNVPRGDLCLRPDVVRALEDASVDPGQLFFLDDPELKNLSRHRLHLVDHNRLCPAQASLEEAVVQIVDHHRDDGRSPAAEREIFFPLGSCASLVARRVLEEKLVEERVARLLLGPILIDTGNLDPKLGKTEKLDQEMAAALAPLCGLEDAEARRVFFESLNDAKFDVSRLSMRDSLRRDYKEFEVAIQSKKKTIRVGMSAVLRNVRELSARELNAAMDAWMTEQRLEVLVVMTAFYAGENRVFSRQNVLVSRDAALEEALARHLEENLKMEHIEVEGLRGRAYSQLDNRPSRKQVAPMVTDFLAAYYENKIKSEL